MRAYIKKTFSTLLTGLLLSLAVSAQTASTIVGKWKSEDAPNRQCEIYLAQDGFYYGRLIYEGGRRENIGKLLLKKLRYDENSKRFKGTLNPPDRDMELSATISFSGNDKLKIVAKKFIVTKTLRFVRTN